MVVYLGSNLLGDSSSDSVSDNIPQEAPSDLLLDIGGNNNNSIPQNISTTPKRRDSNNSFNDNTVEYYFIERLARVPGFSWGRSLIQLSINLIEKYHLLQISVSELVRHQDVKEEDFINLLSQIPWNNLPSFSSINSLQKELLTPLRQVLDYCAEKNYIKALKLVGTILLSCSYIFKDVAMECVTMITSGKWPMKLICSRLLHRIPLFKLKRECLLTLFSQLYNLNQQPALEYAKQPESIRRSHRIEFVKYLLNFPLPNELRASPDSNEYQPVLPIFYQLASHSSSGSHFQRLIIEELFFIGFSLALPQQVSQCQQASLINTLQGECRYCLGLLLEKNPSLMNTFFYCIVRMGDEISVNAIVDFLDSKYFVNWSLDFYSANWLGYLISRWEYPQNDTEVTQDFIGKIINKLVSSPPYQPINEMRPQLIIGSHLMSYINWENVSPSLKMYCSLIILGANLPSSWAIGQLLGPLGSKITSPPLDDLFVQSILTINPSLYPAVADKTIMFQLLLALGILESQYCSRSNEISNPSDTSYGHPWLVSWGFYKRIYDLLQQPQYAPYIVKLLVRCDVLKEEAASAAPYLAGIIRQIASITKNNRETLLELESAMIQSFRQNSRIHGNSEHDKSKRVKLWLEATMPSGRNDKFCCTLLDDLIAYCYCSGYSLDIIVTLIRSRNYSRNDIINFRNDGYRWIVLIILYTYQPVLPRNQRDRECGLHLLQETAQQQSTNAVAVALWLHFFMVYFGNEYQIGDFLSQQIKDNLNKHFINVAKQFEDRVNGLKGLYFAFSTWKKAIIDSATGDFHEEQTHIHLLDDIYSILPQQFHCEFSVNAQGIQNSVSIIPVNHEPFESKPFRPLATEETEDLLMESLPIPIGPPEPKLPDDMKEYTQLENGIENAVSFFIELAQQGATENSSIEVPAISQILALVQNYEQISSNLLSLDQDFLELTKQSYYNFEKPFQVSVACQKDKSCANPAILQGTTVEINAANPNVYSNIQNNRNQYNSLYKELFEISKVIAQTAVLLRNSLELASDRISQESAVAIFFSVTQDVILKNILPQNSPITSVIIQALLYIGRLHIKGNQKYQMKLLDMLFNAPSSIIAPNTKPKISSASSFVGSDDDENENDDNSNILIPADLYELFTPTCLLGTNPFKYLEFLESITAHSDKSEIELSRLSKSFNPKDFLQTIGSQPSSEIIDKICEVIPGLLSSSGFSNVGSAYIEYIVQAGHQNRALGLLFSSAVSEEYSAEFVNNLKLQNANLNTITSLLNQLLEWFPLSDHHITIASELIETITSKSQVFLQQFSIENPSGYDENGKPIDSPLWNIIYQIFSGKGLIREDSRISDNQIARLLNLLLNIVKVCPNAMIDKLWYLFSNSLLKELGKKKLSMSLQQTEQALRNIGSSLPWGKTRFLLYDPNSLNILDQHLHSVPVFICSIFSQLDWDTFTSRLAQSNQPKLISTLGLALLKLVMKISVVNPKAIPSDLYDRLIPDEDKDSSKLLLNWSLINPDEFLSVFNGNVLFSLLKEKLTDRDPSEGLLKNCSILHQIAIQLNNPKSTLAYVRECLSLCFIAISVGNGQYWYLNLADQLSLLSNVVAIVHKFAENSNESKEMIARVLACLTYERWRLERISLPYSLTHSFPDGNDTNPEFSQFYQRVKGIIIQFCSASTSNLSLNIITVLPIPDYFNQSGEGKITPKLWIEIVEGTLRSFFTNTELQNPMENVCFALQKVKQVRNELMEEAKNTSNALVLLSLLNQWKLEVDNMDISTQWPSGLFDYAIGFTPGNYRSFDVLPLWFFVLRLVESPRFHPVQCQQDVSFFIIF